MGLKAKTLNRARFASFLCAIALAACVSAPTREPVNIAQLKLLNLSAGIEAFLRACDALVARDPRFGAPCADPGLARTAPSLFLERYFDAQRIVTRKSPSGFFTGYFEPEIAASRIPQPGYQTPIYGRPADLISVDLGLFRPDLQGRRISGRNQNGRLRPYPERAEIETAGLEAAPVIAWAKDPIELFFLHIQGSGILAFEDGSRTRIGYAGQNGHIYTAIGKPLIESGAIAPEEISLEAIAAWLRQHPQEAATLMRQNRSYVFFADRDQDGPFGTLGTALTPRAALAVDPRHTPLGALVYVDVPIASEDERFAGLVLAADTGGAIAGLGRGDIFFGRGAKARAAASGLKASGQFIQFLPKGWTSQANLAS
ncbi:MAG: murein transglycosylase A [Pseudomonadota bacterium]